MTRTHRCFVFTTLFAALVSLPNPASAQHEAHQTQAPMAGMDHSKMAPAAPAPIRQISGPAEAAFQAFQDALQVGNRDLAIQWLAPDVTVVADGAIDPSREAYANRRMRRDMEFLKASKVMLLDREVHDGGDSAQIVSTSRITGRVGEQPVDIVSKEVAQVRKTPEGWQIVRLERSSAPADESNLPAGSATAAPMDHSTMAMGTGDAKPADPAAMTMGEAKLPVTGAERVMDPACPNADTKTAPKAVHERRVYYFCLDKDRDAFLKDPAAYLKRRPR